MRLLIDTNLFIEVLLSQERADEARAFLENRKGHDLFVSDFTLHSIGLLLFRRKQHHAFRELLNDLIAGLGIEMVSLTIQDMDLLVDVVPRLNLDFDDGYQYGVGIKYGLRIVSFDADFDRTPEGRLLPAGVA